MNERADRQWREAGHKGASPDRAIIDLMLAHVPKDKVEGAYNRAAYMPGGEGSHASGRRSSRRASPRPRPIWASLSAGLIPRLRGGVVRSEAFYHDDGGHEFGGPRWSHLGGK